MWPLTNQTEARSAAIQLSDLVNLAVIYNLHGAIHTNKTHPNNVKGGEVAVIAPLTHI